MTVAQNLVGDMENCKKASRKNEIMRFEMCVSRSNEYKEKESKEIETDFIKESTKMVKDMQLNQMQLIANHKNKLKSIEDNYSKQIASLQNRIINMERSQGSKIQNNKNNNAWQKRSRPNGQQIHLSLQTLLINLCHIVELVRASMMRILVILQEGSYMVDRWEKVNK